MSIFKKKEESVNADYVCKFPECESCEKYVSVREGEMKSLCTVPIIVTKQMYMLFDKVLLKNCEDIIEMKRDIGDIKHEICDLTNKKTATRKQSKTTKKTAQQPEKEANNGNGDDEAK